MHRDTKHFLWFAGSKRETQNALSQSLIYTEFPISVFCRVEKRDPKRIFSIIDLYRISHISSLRLKPLRAPSSRQTTTWVMLQLSSAWRLWAYRIYSINRPGRLLNFWTLRVGIEAQGGQIVISFLFFTFPFLCFTLCFLLRHFAFRLRFRFGAYWLGAY